MEKKTIGIIAAVVGGGCLISGILQVLVIGGVMVGATAALKSCTDNQNQKIEKSKEILTRFTETSLPETLELSDELTLIRQFSTEYIPCNSMYETVILRNYEIIPYLYNSPCDKIAVTMQGEPITGDYFQEINYNYYSYLPAGKEEYLACFNYHDDDITFLSPDGGVICTMPKNDLPDYSGNSDIQPAEQEYLVTQSDSGNSGKGLSDANGNTILNYEYDVINMIQDDIFFLRKDNESWFYDISEAEMTVSGSGILEFHSVGEAFYAVTENENSRFTYTIYAPCKN